MGQVLGIVYRAIASHLIKAASYHHATAQTGAVTLIQRFGGALNLNIHFHMLFLDGVYVTSGERLIFRRVPPPTVDALEKLVRVISERVGRALERQGLLVRDLENSFLTLDSPDDAGIDDLLGHSITYRVALGPHQGGAAFTLRAQAGISRSPSRLLVPLRHQNQGAQKKIKKCAGLLSQLQLTQGPAPLSALVSIEI